MKPETEEKLQRAIYATEDFFSAVWHHRTGRKILLSFISALLVLIVLLIWRPSHRLRITLEAGSELPLASELAKGSDATYRNADDVNLSVPGIYKTVIDSSKGKYTLRVKVVDTVAPTATPTPRNWALGTPRPEASEFVSDIDDATEVTVTYLSFAESPALNQAYPIRILLSDLGGNKTEYETSVTLIRDEEPPTVTVHDVIGYVGYGIAYSKGVTVSDNCCGEITVDWDDSAVDTTKAGEYTVVYTVKDAAGNRQRAEGKVHIYEEEISPEMLFVRIDRILEEILTVDMDLIARIRAVYTYVYDHIAYTGKSDKSDWVREAYQALESGGGDCFSYFALSKAFFERMGLPNLDIERTRGLTDERHYWNYVNIGSEESPAWYYFDATHLNTMQGGAHSGCLLTETQIRAYEHFKPYFYTYDHTGYPAAATKIVTPTPELEPYY